MDAGGTPLRSLSDIARLVISPPSSRLLALILSAIVPGLGMVYVKQTRKGLSLMGMTLALIVLSFVLRSARVSGSITLVPVLHSAVLVALVFLWVYNIVWTLQAYDTSLASLAKRIGIADPMNLFGIRDKLAYIKNLTMNLSRPETNGNLDMMLNNPRRAILHMTAMVSMTFIATKVNGFLDKVWIAHLGDDAVAAVSTVSPIYSVVAAMGVGIGTGACVCISYMLGRSDFERSQELATASVFLGIAVSVPTAIFLVLSIDPIVSVQGGEITRLSREYVTPLAIGCVAIILSGVIGNLFKAEGAMKVMTLCALISIPVNAVLTPLFTMVLGWGVAGASIGTVIGSVVSVIASVYFFARGNYHFKLRLGLPTTGSMKEVLSVGGPKAFEELAGGIIMLAETVIIAVQAGSSAIVLTGLAFSFPYLMTMIPDSVTSGASPVCSVQAGAHNLKVMRSSMRYAVKITLVLSVISAAVLLLLTSQIDSVFTDGDSLEVSDELVAATRLYALIIPFYLIGRMSSNFLQVVRKSQISAPVYTALGCLKLWIVFEFGTGPMEVIYVETVMNAVVGTVMGLLLIHYVRRFDPDREDARSERRFDIMGYVKRTIGMGD